MDFPRISAKGAPFSRGEQYGAQARARIAHCIASYRDLWLLRARLEWDTALAQARSYEPAIAGFAPESLDEMRGIAHGAGVAYDHILALNCRSELMFAAMSRKGELPPGECTSFAVAPEASADGHLLIGQNWDWVPFARDVAVLLEVKRENGPDYTTVVEAGMLAKVGFNSAGLALCTNTHVSASDAGRAGVPYHIILRALLDTETFGAARRLLESTERALSANYLIGHRDGQVANFEAAGGGRPRLSITEPHDGVLSHSNHFLDAELAEDDTYVRQHPHSITRLEGMRKGLRSGKLNVERMKAILRDHENAPNGVCSHPDPKANPLLARTTVASVVADLTEGSAWIASGPPCSSEYRLLPLRQVVAAVDAQDR